jgi:arsenate reductase (thioredoxin)
MKRVLFVCIHNSARSQMAEEILRKKAGNHFFVESAGLEPGTLNPTVVALLKEKGIDISLKKTQKVADVLNEGRTYDYVIAVCDGANAERCPIFPGASQRIHWRFTDPSQFAGSPEEKMQKVREVYLEIEEAIRKWLATNP